MENSSGVEQLKHIVRSFWSTLVFTPHNPELQLSRTEKFIAASVALVISLFFLYAFWRILKALMRAKAIRSQLEKFDNAELRRVLGSSENFESIRSQSDDIWINVTIFLFSIFIGTGTLIGLLSSLANFGQFVLQ